MRKMKILILVKSMQHRTKNKACGVGVVAEELMNQWISQGHECKLLSREDDFKADSVAKGIWKIRKYVKEHEHEYDVIYTHDWSMALPLMFPYVLAGEKHYCHFHGVENKTPFMQDIVGKQLKHRLIVLHDQHAKAFKSSLQVNNAANFETFKNINLKRKYVGFVDKPGEHPEIREIARQISKELKMPLLIAKEIHFSKMNRFYNECKVFISLCEDTAGFGLVWLEAMSAQVPLIIGNEQGCGPKLPIEILMTKNDSKEYIIKAAIKSIKSPLSKTDYRKWLINSDYSWEKISKKILNKIEKEVMNE